MHISYSSAVTHTPIRFNTIDEIKDKIDLERSCIIFIDYYDVHFIFPAFRLAKEQISNCRNPEIRAAFEQILSWFETEAKKYYDNNIETKRLHQVLGWIEIDE